jgi:glucosylceramidase
MTSGHPSRRAVLRAAAGGAALPLAALAAACDSGPAAGNAVTAQRMATTPDLSSQVMARTRLPAFTPVTAGPADVVVNPSRTYQPFLGTGAALTDSAAYVLTTYLPATARAALLSELYSPARCNWRMLRVCMGSPDFRAQPFGYTYDDMPAAATDPGLARFSVARDTTYITPLITQILAINPAVKIIAAPWTPPAWMLASGTFEQNGCTFDDSWMGAYARYFVRFLRAYQALGIPVWAVSCQNEPVTGTFMNLGRGEEETFIGSHLGPALRAAGLGHVKILALDDDWDQYGYGAAVFGSATARPFTAGIAYHGYAGSPAVMTTVHETHPAAAQHLTEFRSMVSESPQAQMASVAGGYVAQGVAHYAQSVMLWNLALDQNGRPNQDKPGRIGVVTVDSGTGAVTRSIGYYALTHLSVFAQPGAVRCAVTTFGSSYRSASGLPRGVTTTALANPDGSAVLYAYNGLAGDASFHVVDARTGRGTPVTMTPGELSTFRWPAGQ